MSAATSQEHLVDEEFVVESRTGPVLRLRDVGDLPAPGDRRADRGIAMENGVFDLVRAFVEHVVSDPPGSHAIDWTSVRAEVAGARSLEQAAGRAVLVALRMRRDAAPTDVLAAEGEDLEALVAWHARTDDPFFAFSVADVVPDFGDESRYRAKVARRFARVMGIGRRPVDATTPVSAEAQTASTQPETPE